MTFQMKYLGKEAYVFPTTPKHLSPCQDPYWRAQPMRQGIMRDEIEHEEIEDDMEEKE